MTHTLAAIFNNRADANGARNALIDAGFDGDTIHLSDSDTLADAGQQFDAIVSSDEAGDTIADNIRHFFSRFLGSDHRERRVYSEAIKRGCVMLTVQAANREQAGDAAIIVETFGPSEIDQQQAPWGVGGWTGANVEQSGAFIHQSDAGSQQGLSQQRTLSQPT